MSSNSSSRKCRTNEFLFKGQEGPRAARAHAVPRVTPPHADGRMALSISTPIGAPRASKHKGQFLRGRGLLCVRRTVGRVSSGQFARSLASLCPPNIHRCAARDAVARPARLPEANGPPRIAPPCPADASRPGAWAAA